jgi:hypothetical protein
MRAAASGVRSSLLVDIVRSDSAAARELLLGQQHGHRRVDVEHVRRKRLSAATSSRTAA